MIRAIRNIARVIANMRHRSTRMLALWTVGALGVALVLSLSTVMPDIASAHGIAGNRFFPTTFTVDDPFISDEFSLLIHHNKQSGDPASRKLISTSTIPNAFSRTSGLNFMKHTYTRSLMTEVPSTGGIILVQEQNGSSLPMILMN